MAAVCLVWLAITTGGCGPKLSPEELGEVEFKIPDVPGADEPYLFPDDEPPDEETTSATESDAGEAAHGCHSGVSPVPYVFDKQAACRYGRRVPLLARQQCPRQPSPCS